MSWLYKLWVCICRRFRSASSGALVSGDCVEVLSVGIQLQRARIRIDGKTEVTIQVSPERFVSVGDCLLWTIENPSRGGLHIKPGSNLISAFSIKE